MNMDDVFGKNLQKLSSKEEKRRKLKDSSTEDASNDVSFTSLSTDRRVQAARVDKSARKKRRRKNSIADGKTTSPAPANTFASVTPSLSDGILAAVASYNFQSMTPVQSAVIPLFLTNKDVCVQAVTGSGKTLAFLIPLAEMIIRRTTLLKRRQVGGLIISPTRELARQTHAVATNLCCHCSLPDPLLLVGGANRPVSADLQTFVKAGSDIVVATPGRLDDVLSRYDDIDVSELEVLVLDEADVLLDMGFEVTLTNILARLPRMRRTGLFSATKPIGSGNVKGLIKRAGMRNPVVIDVAIARANQQKLHGSNTTSDGPSGDQPSNSERNSFSKQEQATPSSLTNYFLISPLDQKLSRLVAFMRQHKEDKIIVFFLTCACVEFYGAALQRILSEKDGFYLELLHGKQVQKRREKAMERFRLCEGKDGKKKRGGVLLCTDVASRGLDVYGIQWTVQFDAPVDPSSYVHRVGRSARAGAFGSSLIFLTPKEEAYVDFLRMRKVPLDAIPNDEICAPSLNRDGESDESGTEAKKESNEQRQNVGRVITTASDPDTLIPDILPIILSHVIKDRDILEKGTKAFTSYIRAYKEHQCAFIFRFASLDLGALATSFSLLRLPKMPELKDKLGKLSFVPAGPEIDIYAIKYKDKVREKARQKRLATELAAGGKNAKQIKAEQRAAEKIRRQKEKRAAEIAKGRNPNKKRGKQAQIYDEWEALAKEERLHKKLRQGKISKDKFKELMYAGSGANGKKSSDDYAIDDSDIEV